MNKMLMQKIIGVVLAIIGIAGSGIVLIIAGIFLFFTKLNYVGGYGDPRGRDRDGLR